MARVFKEEEYNTRRNEILDVVQGLFYTKGYEQTTIQDILNALQISKGAFYHYFDSKQDLLDAMVNRISEAGLNVIRPIVADPQLTAMEKFTRLFSAAVAWKTDQMDLMLTLLHAWYTDDNALLRQKTTASILREFTPMLTAVIQEGIEEGVFSVPYPEKVGEVLFSLFLGMGDSMANEFLDIDQSLNEPERLENFRKVEQTVAAYTGALERVLGAEPGSLTLVDIDTLKVWFIPESDSIRANG